MQLTLVAEPEKLLETAFRRARKEADKMGKVGGSGRGVRGGGQRDRLIEAKAKTIRKVEVACNYFDESLQKAVQGTPSISQLHPFYKELIEATVDVNALLNALGQMTSAGRVAHKIKRRYIGKIKGLKRGGEKKADAMVGQFYGRMASVAKSLRKSIEEYTKAASKMRELPTIEFDIPTVIIAGYPNTGKTTLLGRLTGSKPKIAPYPFTTQHLQIGHLIHNYKRLQLIDTPGLLDRPLEKRNKIEKKAIAALRHLANAIVFVADPTTYCGFELEKQANLFNEIKREFQTVPLIAVINKADIAGPEEIAKAREAFGGDAIVEGEGIEGGLREKLIGLGLKEKDPALAEKPA